MCQSLLPATLTEPDCAKAPYKYLNSRAFPFLIPSPSAPPRLNRVRTRGAVQEKTASSPHLSASRPTQTPIQNQTKVLVHLFQVCHPETLQRSCSQQTSTRRKQTPTHPHGFSQLLPLHGRRCAADTKIVDARRSHDRVVITAAQDGRQGRRPSVAKTTDNCTAPKDPPGQS